ncbi:hypothetical protein DFQ26_005357 [Actinomortierella ambigua]|nr:hypothetical protein DFQ26_005357 [Actinomortierella ambigua]
MGGGNNNTSTSTGSSSSSSGSSQGTSYHIEITGGAAAHSGHHHRHSDDDGYEMGEAGDRYYRDNHPLGQHQTDRAQQRRQRRRRRHASDEAHLSDTVRKAGLYGKAHIKGRFKLVRMVLLTTSLMGLQFTWAVEMAYGTPFLLQLGLSKSLMSLVWLAGPLSGLVMQPVLDVITILMAVASIYILDFAINCVQASCRTLIVDSLPSSQQEEAASWASRLMGLGGIFGYFMGNVNLPEVLPAFGDTQIKGLCIVACLFLIVNVGLTCWAVTERVMVRSSSSSSMSEFLGGFRSIIQSIRHLPLQIQRLCNVQFFAWMGWFPFLFYSSTYIAEIFLREKQQHQAPEEGEHQAAPSAVELNDAAVRAGSYCLLVYSIVSLVASMLLPVFVAPAVPSHQHHHSSPSSPLPPTTTTSTSGNGRWARLFENQDRRSSPSPHSSSSMSSSAWWRRWQRRLKPRWLVLPIPWLTLPRMYTLSLGLLSLSLLLTWMVQDIQGSTILFSMCGVAWAVSMWAPFSILGEVISQQLQEQQHQERMHDSGGAHHLGGEGGDSEMMFEADSHFDDDHGRGGDHSDETRLLAMQGIVVEDEEGQEEIRMVENKRYRPVAVHADSSPVATTTTTTTYGRSTTSESRWNRNGVSAVLDVETADSGASVYHDYHYSDPHSQRRGGGHMDGNSSLASIETVVPETSKERYAGPNHSLEEIQVDGDGRDSIEEATLEGDGDEETQKLVQTRLSSSSSSGVSHRQEGDLEAMRVRTGGGGGGGSEGGAMIGTSAGALLGIHNIYIVLPQFLVSFLSSLVFAAIESGSNATVDDTGGGGTTKAGVEGDQPADPNTIGVMLRFGGLMAGVAAVLSLRLWRAPALGGRW